MSNETFFQLMFIIILIFYLAFQLYQFGRQHNCPYCHSESKLIHEDDDSKINVFIGEYPGNIEIRGLGIYAHKNINYCPICARRLR